MKHRGNLAKGLIVTVSVFAALAIAAVLLIGNISRMQSEAELSMVRSAVRSAALTCYAVEGAYPSDVSYLREHYGLSWDESLYLVRYDAFSSNIFPDIYVLERGGGEQ